MRDSWVTRLSTTAQDVAYAAAKGIEGSYGPSVRNAVREIGRGALPVTETIKKRKNKPLEET